VAANSLPYCCPSKRWVTRTSPNEPVSGPCQCAPPAIRTVSPATSPTWLEAPSTTTAEPRARALSRSSAALKSARRGAREAVSSTPGSPPPATREASFPAAATSDAAPPVVGGERRTPWKRWSRFPSTW
jgi:hypothetical protein